MQPFSVRNLLIAASYALLSAVITYPLITQMFTHLPGHPFGDSAEYANLIWWFGHALRTGGSPYVHDLLLAPHGLDAAYLWSIPFQSFPAWIFALVMPASAALGTTILLFLTLNGLSMYTLMQALLHGQPARRPAAWIAGVAFLSLPAVQGQIGAGHLGVIALFPMPILILGFHRVIERGSARWLALTAAAFCASLWGSLTTLIYVTAPISMFFVVALLIRRRWGALLRLAAALAAGSLLSLIFILPYLLSDTPIVDRDASLYSTAALSFTAPSFYHPLYASLNFNRAILGVDPFEGAAYIGLISGLLATAALFRVRTARPWLILAAAAWLVSLGSFLKLTDQPVSVSLGGFSTLIPLPYAVLDALPVISSTRTPARFSLTLGLAISIMAGYGAALILRRVQRGTFVVAAAIIALIAFDTRWFWDFPMTPASVPPALVSLRERDDIRTVFDVPWNHPLTDKYAMFLQTTHQTPILGGHIARQTPLNPAVGWLLQGTLDPALLNAYGVDIVVVHRQWADAEGELERRARAQLDDPLSEDADYLVFDVPETDDPPLFAFVSSNDGEIADTTGIAVYAPQPGTALLTGVMRTEGRRGEISLNEVPLLEFTSRSGVGLRLPLTFETAGLHWLTISSEPACPTVIDPRLACVPLTIADLSLAEYMPMIE